jgi:hypothetical protein
MPAAVLFVNSYWIEWTRGIFSRRWRSNSTRGSRVDLRGRIWKKLQRAQIFPLLHDLRRGRVHQDAIYDLLAGKTETRQRRFGQMGEAVARIMAVSRLRRWYCTSLLLAPSREILRKKHSGFRQKAPARKGRALTPSGRLNSTDLEAGSITHNARRTLPCWPRQWLSCGRKNRCRGGSAGFACHWRR